MDVTSILAGTVCFVLPLLSLVVFVAGLLWRGACPSWLLVCAAVPPALAIASLLVLQQQDAGVGTMFTVALTAWFVLCLIFLGLALARRRRAQRSRPLEYAGLTMPLIALALLTGIFVVLLLSPAPQGDEPGLGRLDRQVHTAAACAQAEACSAAGRC
jgi:heme/copper-type cytochrome/quinol oxidase subunit 2